MEPNYRRDHFGYQANPNYMGAGSDDSNNSETGGDHNTQDILNSFPYLRHAGFRQQFGGALPHTQVPNTAQNLISSSNQMMNNYQPGFMQMSNTHMASNTNSFLPGFSQQSKLPGMATFNTAFSNIQHQLPPSSFTNLVTSAHLSQQPPPFTANLPQPPSTGNLPLTSLMSPDSYGTNIFSSQGIANPPMQSSHHISMSASLESSSITTNIPTSIDTYASNPPVSTSFAYLGNFHQADISGNVTKSSADILSSQSNLSDSKERDEQLQKVKQFLMAPYEQPRGRNRSENTASTPPVGGTDTTNTDLEAFEKNTNTPVKFQLKGSLVHKKDDVLKTAQEIMKEPVDAEDVVYDNYVHNVSSKAKTSSDGSSLISIPIPSSKSRSTIPKPTRYTEPSIAEIRASALRATKDADSSVDADESIDKEPDYDADISATNDSLSFGIGEGNIHASWYSSALKKYADIAKDENTSDEVALSVKKGGRSDPDNPFAITSPSFSESAARALMTTTNSSMATFVTISIMSIGSRKKLIPKIVSSPAAEGGIVSVVNPIETLDKSDAETEADSELKADKMSIMSKLKREKQAKQEQEEEEADTEIDRLDISIKIEDTQLVSHGEHKRWQCKMCPKSYTTKHNLVAHILDHSGIKPHLCLVCGKYFKQLSHLNTHMLTHDNVKPHVCPICNKGFTQISHLKRHETVHLGSKPYKCDICNRGFAYPSELRLHKDKHVPGKEKCMECDLEFDTQKELHNHILNDKHCNNLACKHCDRVFRFPSQLRDHMMSHAGSRPFICTECGMDFMKEHHLKAHQFTHTGLRPYSCPHCSRSFNQKANMVRHMLIHNAERAFKCEVCSKTFTQPQTLKAHMVVHSEKKPYSCKICGKQFGRQHNLQGHLHIHSDSKPYVCSICQSSFTLKGNLNRHKKVKHGLNETTENMEEDAVNFLSSLSDRVRDNKPPSINFEAEFDADSRDDMALADLKSQKKGRKSIPRKHISRTVVGDGEGDGGTDMETNSEGETDEPSNVISYSDEERENERVQQTKSKNLESSDSENSNLRRRRKREVCYRVENEEEDENYYDHVERASHEGEAEVIKDSDTELTEKDENENGVTKSDAQAAGKVIVEKRSMRKRKKKELDEWFTDQDIDDFDGDEQHPPLKSRRRKGAKLDTIIATKFKNP